MMKGSALRYTNVFDIVFVEVNIMQEVLSVEGSDLRYTNIII
jgi:hypothetical protein